MNFTATLIACLLCFHLYSQSQTDFGFADKSIPEMSQFEYYRGVWKSDIEVKQDDGTFKKLESAATVKAQFLEDHKTFQTQFTTPDGFFSTDLRTFDTTKKEWKALFLNANAQRWHQFTCEFMDGKMTTLVVGGYSGKEKFDIKGVDTVVSDKSYQRNIYYSYDSMATWELVYKMYYTRIQ